MIWILILAALAADVSSFDFKVNVLLTKQSFCKSNNIHRERQCDNIFDNYLVANPHIVKCAPACPVYSNQCQDLPLNVRTCSLQYGTEMVEKPVLDVRERTGNPEDVEVPESTSPLHSKVMNFTLELFKRAVPKGNDKGNHNYVLSPVMVQSLLSYLTDGASKETRRVMKSVLKLTETDLNELRRVIEPSAERLSTKNKLDIASQIFRSSVVEFFDEFVQSLKNKKVTQEPMDFSNKAYAAQRINDWVNQKTRGRILDAVDADALNPDTKLLLLNALYFNGTWMYQFNGTKQGTFEVNQNQQIPANMMHLIRNLRSGYTKNEERWNQHEGFMWVELPYDGDMISMILLLPKERHQLDRELQKFNQQDLEHILSEIAMNDQDEVNLMLPEFKAESKVSLVDPLREMGLSSLFDDDKPFDKISNDNVKISDVKQKSFLTVNQYGTVATSVTYATIIPLSIPRSTKFHADQPFAAIIVDKDNRLPLFLAKINSPQKITKKNRRT